MLRLPKLRCAWIVALATTFCAGSALFAAVDPVRRPLARGKPVIPPPALHGNVVVISSSWERVVDLPAGRALEISVALEKPSALPPNARLAVEWALIPSSGATSPMGAEEARKPEHGAADAKPAPSEKKEPAPPDPPGTPEKKPETVTAAGPRKWNAFGIYTRPTPGWRKVLHALDSDVYLVYRAPVAGKYALRLTPVTDEEPVGSGPRLREKGSAPQLFPVPKLTPWPAGTTAPVRIHLKTLDLSPSAASPSTVVEVEPNDTPEQAQTLGMADSAGISTWEVTGGADDIEFYDNGRAGKSGDDWFRIEYTGKEPRLLTAQLGIPGQFLAAQIRCYRLTAKEGEPKTAPLGGLLPVAEYTEGKDENERVHQQDEEHRANICRLLKPGETYFLRVEANAPGYQLQLRVLPPAPYTDPRMAIRQAVYTQIGQVDAWLTNRPRGASVERRIRDTGNLLGTQCMSCHTQSGVWGPAAAFERGYRLENVQNYWHLINVMYECLRPTNELKDAANNTSLAPLDIGDGPAGTRVAGFNIVNLERIKSPRKLHSTQQIRTANYVLLTSDPGGINAASTGSNVGQVVVHLFAAEIVKTAWEKTGDPKFFRALEEKARRVLGVKPKYTDDVALRLDFFYRVLPLHEYPRWEARASEAEAAIFRAPESVAGAKHDPAAVDDLIARARKQIAEDEARLRAIQNEDGSWGFNPGTVSADGKTWTVSDRKPDPAPTALGIMGLNSAGYGSNEPAVARAVKALLAMQDPSGRWNKAAITGFVTTAYAIHALSRLYPEESKQARPEAALPAPLPLAVAVARDIARVQAARRASAPSLLAVIQMTQKAALSADAGAVPTLVSRSAHESPLVRYWAMIGLGATHTEQGVPALTAGLGDPVKMVRDAAAWGLRQTLLDDKGWETTFTAYERGDDRTREQVMQVLNMRADAVMPQASFEWKRLTDILDRGMNVDRHPGVRAWASRAAWQWWVWNPPVRAAVNASWVKMLERPESNALVENSNRYASQALFIVNGHKANASSEHQYKELETLFKTLKERLEAKEDAGRASRLARRLVGIGGTFFTTSGGDGGPGQMGYSTDGASDTMGKAALAYLQEVTRGSDMTAIKIGLEGAANIPYRDLTAFLVDYSLKGPEEVRMLAASAVSDARSVSLAAVPELVEPQLEQVKRGAQEAPRRPQISDPILDLWGKVNWVVPKTEEQQKAFFDLIIPRFSTYASPEEIKAIPNAARRAEVEKEMDAAWYLADKLGQVLEKNPDLHHEIVFRRYFPEKFRNPLEQHFWLRSVEWLLNFKKPAASAVGEAGVVAVSQGQPEMQPDEVLTIKDRALQLYLDQLRPGTDPKTRAIAIRMSNKTALRSNPEVLRALTEALKFEKDDALIKIIENVLKQGTEKFMPELVTALKKEKDPSVTFNAAGEPELTKPQTEDILYFRDYVMPELSRQKRSDQMSCLGCHGVAGRVPSFGLKPADEHGYIAPADLLSNYRGLQQRVLLTDLERSKILRKPLNIQDGNEDGHQGGRRYGPTDEGYLLLKKWVESQPQVQKPADSGKQAAPAPPEKSGSVPADRPG